MKHPPRNLALTLLLCATAGAQPVVSNTYETPAGAKPLADTPITVSRIGADGDFTKGICPSIGGKKLPAQVDVLRRAPDGSIRHALVSFVGPETLPDGRLKIDWLNEAAPAPPEFGWGFDLADFDLQLRFVTKDGRVLISDPGKLKAGSERTTPRTTNSRPRTARPTATTRRMPSPTPPPCACSTPRSWRRTGRRGPWK